MPLFEFWNRYFFLFAHAQTNSFNKRPLRSFSWSEFSYEFLPIKKPSYVSALSQNLKYLIKEIFIRNLIKMETSVDPILIEHVQLLAQCDISKEVLTDSIAYFQGKYFFISF